MSFNMLGFVAPESVSLGRKSIRKKKKDTSDCENNMFHKSTPEDLYIICKGISGYVV